jgi:hypothetical protein
MDSFVRRINGPGWYKLHNVVDKNELFNVTIMSFAVFIFSITRNRHGWSVATEKNKTGDNLFQLFFIICCKQFTRGIAFAKSWIVAILFARLQTKQILKEGFFRSKF